MLAHDRLLAVLNYERGTGIFRWKITKTGWRGGIIALPGERAGHAKRGGYQNIIIDGKAYASHRLAWFYVTGKWPEMAIDHKDGDPTNNRWDNLRLATPAQNAANSQKSMAGELRHGIQYRSGKWRAKITADLGAYNTAEEAVFAYSEAHKKLFGESSRYD